MDHLGIFAKFWTPGKVKTRLAATIGDVESASVYHAMLNYLVDNLQTVGDQRTIAFTPQTSQPSFLELGASTDSTWQCVAQVDGSLGQRMTHFFSSAFSDSKTRNVVLIGSDCPMITPDLCRDAFAALQNNDVVLGPTFDGGYYLVGMSNRFYDVFSGITYSTESVLGQTIKKLQADQRAFALLPQLQDIDEFPQLFDLYKTLTDQRQPNQSALLSIVQDAVSSERSK